MQAKIYKILNMEGIPSIEPFVARLEALGAKMSEPDFYNDQRKAGEISREHQKLSKLRETYEKLEKRSRR